MRYKPDGDRSWASFGAGAGDDQPPTPPEPPPQAYGYQGGETFEAAQAGTHHWASAADTTDWGSFHGTGLVESFEVPQTGTYWQEPTFTELPSEPVDGFPDDITDVQEAPEPPSEPFTAGYFAT